MTLTSCVSELYILEIALSLLCVDFMINELQVTDYELFDSEPIKALLVCQYPN